MSVDLQFKARISSIDRIDNSGNDVEPANDDVEPEDEEQTEAPVSNVSLYIFAVIETKKILAYCMMNYPCLFHFTIANNPY